MKLDEQQGWFIVPVSAAHWSENEAFGRMASFEMQGRFPQTGVRLFLLEPGKPNCHYHREDAQEDFLVLSGECNVLLNGETHALKAWDYLHCPAGVTHVFSGAGDQPCALLAIGHRPGEKGPRWFYPQNETAKALGAETPQPTHDPRVSYAKAPAWTEIDPPDWPIEG